MLSRSLFSLVYGLSSMSLALAAISVPSDLSSGFEPDSIELEVTYGQLADGTNGFTDGTKLSTQQTAEAPTFSLSDSSGVSSSLRTILVMVDTSSDNDRVLHFIQSDFQPSGTKTGLSSTTQPQFGYKAPGTLGDSGERQYCWLMYEQHGTFSASSLPAPGDKFDVASFQSANGLSNPIAGNIMAVDVQDSSNSNSNNNNDTPSQSTTDDPSPNTAPLVAATSQQASPQLTPLGPAGPPAATTTSAPASLPPLQGPPPDLSSSAPITTLKFTPTHSPQVPTTHAVRTSTLITTQTAAASSSAPGASSSSVPASPKSAAGAIRVSVAEILGAVFLVLMGLVVV